MDKFTLFELHVHDGMEFSATNTAPAIGRSDEETAELEEYVDAESDAEEEMDDDTASSRRPGPLALVLGVVALALVALAVRKLRGGDAELEIADLDDLTDDETLDEEEAAH